MGVIRTDLNKVLSMLIALLLCLVFCIAAPTSAHAHPHTAEQASEWRQGGQMPLVFAVNEASANAFYNVLQLDKLFLAKLAAFLLKELYPFSSADAHALPVYPVYDRISPISTILTKGP